MRLTLALRVVWYDEDGLQAVGTVELAVQAPQPLPMPARKEGPLHYTVPILYWVNRDEAIPGTTVTYQGKMDQGALLGGVEGYPYRKQATPSCGKAACGTASGSIWRAAPASLTRSGSRCSAWLRSGWTWSREKPYSA